MSCYSSGAVPSSTRASQNSRNAAKCFFAVLGLSIRCFTTLTEVADPMVLASQVVPLLLQSMLLLQLLALPGGAGAGGEKKE